VAGIRRSAGAPASGGAAAHYEELNQAIPKKQSYKPINREGYCQSIYCRPDYVLEIG